MHICTLLTYFGVGEGAFPPTTNRNPDLSSIHVKTCVGKLADLGVTNLANLNLLLTLLASITVGT